MHALIDAVNTCTLYRVPFSRPCLFSICARDSIETLSINYRGCVIFLQLSIKKPLSIILNY